MKSIFSLILIALLSFSTSARCSDLSGSEISGKIYDRETEETLPFATIQVYKGDEFVTGSIADEFGLYSIKPIEAGSYDLKFSFTNYQELIIQGVIVSEGQITFLDADLELNMGTVIVVPGYRIFEKPLIELDRMSSGELFIASEIKKMPTKDPNQVITYSASIYQSDIGEPIQVRGSRPGSTLYLLDGMRVNNFRGIPSSAVSQLRVITGGIPAKYGDTTAGVIILNTN